MNEYTMQASYANYLLENMMQEENLNHCINEALILTEGVNIASKLQNLNEAAGEKIKEVWQKFVAFIKKIYAKFTEVINRVLQTDKAYLEQYAKIIQSKPFKLDVTCRDYQIDRVVSAQVPLFNYSMLQSKLSSKSVFMHSVINAFGENDNADDLNGWCKAYFCNGKEEEVKLSNLNLGDLYNFCHDFKEKTLPRLNQDQDNIDKSSVNANSLILSAIRGSQAKEQSPTQQPQSATPASQPAQPAAKQESALNPYSTLLGKVLSELKIENNNAPAQQDASGAAPATPAPEGTTGEPETKASAEKAASSNDLTEQKVQEVIAIYSSVASAIASSKITIAQWAYNDYMKIIRAHVQMYAGEGEVKKPAPENQPAAEPAK